jgi:hypothetical protein
MPRILSQQYLCVTHTGGGIFKVAFDGLKKKFTSPKKTTCEIEKTDSNSSTSSLQSSQKGEMRGKFAFLIHRS